jgi:hypothetical protein
MKRYSENKKKYDTEIIIWEFSWMNVGFWKKKNQEVHVMFQ